MRRPLPTLARLVALTLLAAACKDSNGPEKPGAPVDIRISAGDNQKGVAGAALVAPIAAKVTDAKGRGVPNVTVNFTTDPGNGAVAPPQAVTNSAGVAISSWTLPASGGTFVARAGFIDTNSGALVDTVSFHAKAVGGTPVGMTAVYDFPPRAATGSTQRITMVLWDRYGIPSPGATVTFTATGGGSVSPASVVTDSLGRAAVNWTLGAAAGTNSLHAASGSLISDIAISAVVPGIPSSISTAPYSGIAGTGTTIPLAAVVRDGLDQPVAGVTVTWSVLAGGGTLSATTSTTNAQGQATVSYTVGSTPGTNTVRAAAGSLSTTFGFQGRLLAPQLAYLGSRAFGVGRTSGGTFVASLIDAGRVVIFNESTPTTQRSVTTGGTPVVVAVDDAGTTAYVSNMTGWVDVISIAGGTDTQVPVSGAHSLTMSPRGDKVFVASYDGAVYVLSTSTKQTTGSVAVANGPWGIAFKFNATDSLMYVTARDGGTVTEIDTKSLTPVRVFTIGGRPHGIAISADQTKLYVADDAQGLVRVVDIASGNVTGSVSIPGAFGIAISPDGSTLFVTSDAGKGYAIATSNLGVLKIYDMNGNGRQVIASPDGTKAWTATEGGSIDIIER